MFALCGGMVVYNAHHFNACQRLQVSFPDSPRRDAGHLAPAATDGARAGAPDDGPTCRAFFSIFSSAYTPKERYAVDDPKPCKQLFGVGRYRPVMDRQELQMAKANSTLTVFTSFSAEQLRHPKCHPQRNYTHVLFRQFDPDALLRLHGFAEQEVGWIRSWGDQKGVDPHVVAARGSDVLRVALAREHRLAYLDLDMFLAPPPAAPGRRPADLYLAGPVVAVPVWHQSQGALEVQNSGFCFTAAQLDHLLREQRAIIRSKGERQVYDRYTELGPNVFHHAIQALTALAPTRLLFTTSNRDASPRLVRKRRDLYRSEMYWFHLDGRFRGANIAVLKEAFDQVFDGYDPRAADPLRAF